MPEIIQPQQITQPEHSLPEIDQNELVQNGFMARMVPDRLRRPLALISGLAAFGGSIATVEAIGGGVADAQTTTTETTTTCDHGILTNQQESVPHKGCWDPSKDTDAEVIYCQTSVMDKKTNKYDMIASRSLSSKLGSKQIKFNAGLRRIQYWVGNEFYYACAEVTDNYVKEQLVENTGNSTHPRAKDIKALGNVVIARGDDSTEFDGIFRKIVATSKPFSLPRDLRASDITGHRYGVRDTIVSRPLFQRPYVDQYNPDQSVPGPVYTRHSPPHITWLK